MNETFSLRRFRLLVKYQWSVNRKKFLLISLLITMFVLLITLFLEKNGDVWGLFMIIFATGSGFISLITFPNWNNFGRSSAYLMIPSSSAEKFVTSVFYSVILYIPAFILIFFLGRYFLTYLVVMVLPYRLMGVGQDIRSELYEIVKYVMTNGLPVFLLIVVFLAILLSQSVFTFAAIRFKKYNFQIAFLIIIGIFFLYNFLIIRIAGWVIKEPVSSVSQPGFIPFDLNYFSYSSYKGSESNYESFHFIRSFSVLNYVIWLMIFIFLNISTLKRLKEREL